MILTTSTARLAAILAAFTPLLADAFVVRSPTLTAGLAIQQTRLGRRVSPPFVLSDMVESSEDSPELVVEEEETKEETSSISEETASTSDEEMSSSTSEEVSSTSTSEEEASSTSKEEASSSTSEESPKRVVARERHTAFVGNLPFDITEADVRELFEKHGEVQLVSMPRNRNTGQFRGFAFVDLANEEDLETAVSALDNSDLNGRLLRVSKSLPKDQLEKKKQPVKADRPEMQEGYKRVYVGNIPFDCTKEDIVELYSKYGEISEIFLPVDAETGSGRGFAFITMKEEEADAAIEGTNGQEFGGRTLVVNEPLPPGKRAARTFVKNGNRTKLYIGNLSFYTVRDTLKEIFEEFGTVHDCYMPEDPSIGGSRGFGFITMDTEEAEKAIEELDGCEVDGRIIRVNVAQPKGKSSNSYNDDDDDTD